jgi:hypothetical protein
MTTKDEKSDERERVAIFSANCFECAHLRADKTKLFKACHFSAGNRFCPAEGLIFVTVGEAYQLAEQVHDARDKRDAETEARILRKAASLNDYSRERFYAAVENRKLIEKFVANNH